MNANETVLIYPTGHPELKAFATVVIVSANQRAIAVGFDERPPFDWGDPLSMAIHPAFGIMLFASRKTPSGDFEEMLSGQPFTVEEV